MVKTPRTQQQMSHDEWSRRYTRLRTIAEGIDKSRTARARRLCQEAGLDPTLLGIHPHNAMCGLAYGNPWPGVDYQKVRECLWMMARSGEGYRIVDRWSKRVRTS